MNALLRKILSYLDIRTMFRKTDRPNINLRMMHGMNRISILMFLICVVMLLVRYVF
ncbi:MAG: hypothetical protein RIC15_01260 [Vicingaceae bacterium]